MKQKRKLLRFREFVKLQNRQTKKVPTEASAGADDNIRQANLSSDISFGDQKLLEKSY